MIDWTISHAFLVTMGGYHFYNAAGPVHPLTPDMVVELVRRGHIVPPTAQELASQSKGDGLSKCVAVVQTLWFVAQCIARHKSNLPLTNLEVMTLAYTVMTLAMYMAWWAKPLNVACAIRVAEEPVFMPDIVENEMTAESLVSQFGGFHDWYVNISRRRAVPTFWAGCPEIEDVTAADIVSLVVSMIFGAVHCIAWFSTFHSPLQQEVWRSSAIAIAAVPVVAAGTHILNVFLFTLLPKDTTIPLYITIPIQASSVLIYIAARISLLIISFTSLESSPFGAYQTVQWTLLIPHI